MHNNNEIRLVKVFCFYQCAMIFYTRLTFTFFSGNVKSDIPCIYYIPTLFLQFNFNVPSTPCLYLLRTFDFDEKVTITKLISYFPQCLLDLPAFHNTHHLHISIEKWWHYSSITSIFWKDYFFRIHHWSYLSCLLNGRLAHMRFEN